MINMPKLLELPLSGKIRKDFESFFSATNSTAENWDLHDNYNPLEPKSKSCFICGHGIKNPVGFRNMETDQRVDIGVVCASNLLSLGMYYKGNIDKLNFDRQVRLEKKTIMKRLAERIAEQEMEQIKIKHGDIVDYLEKFKNAIIDEFVPDRIKKDIDEIHIMELPRYCNWTNNFFHYNIEFFFSIYDSIKHGKLTDNQLRAMKKCIEIPIEERLDKIRREMAVITEKRKMETDSAEAIRLIDCFLEERPSYGGYVYQNWFVNIWSKHKSFLIDLKRQFNQRNFLTDNQIKAIEKIHGRYKHNCIHGNRREQCERCGSEVVCPIGHPEPPSYYCDVCMERSD